MTVEYAFLDSLIAAARFTVQQDLIAEEVDVSGVVTIDFRTGGLSKTLYVDRDLDELIVIPPTLQFPKTSVMFRLFLQHPDPGPTFSINEFSGITGYFGSAPVLSATAGARDLLALTYDNGVYGGVWGMFTQGAPV